MGKLDKFARTAKPLSKQEEIKNVNFAMEQQSNGVVNKRLNLWDIKPNPMNDYAEEDTEEGIQILADDIFHNGLLHNLVVNKNQDTGEFVLISGERRWRALNILKNDEERNADSQWNTVDVKCFVGLTERQSCIRMDAANLQARGGIRDEKKLRKVLNRYIDNLKAEYGISEEAAIALAKEISASSSRTVDYNRSIELNMIEPLIKLVDDGVLAKKWAVALLNFSEEEQQKVVDILSATRDASYPDEHEKARAIRNATTRIVEVSDTTGETRKESLDRIAASAIGKASGQAEKVPVHTSTTVRNSRQEYIKKFEAMAEKARRMSSKKRLEDIAAFEAMAGESDEKILDTIQQSIEELQGVYDKVNALMMCNRAIASGVMDDGRKATAEDIRNIKRIKKSIFDGSYTPAKPHKQMAGDEENA